MTMNDLRTIAPSCGVLLGSDARGRFDHVGTAWCVGDGEWVTAWASEDAPTNLRLLGVNSGTTAEITDWEAENGIAGFHATLPGTIPVLPLRRNKELHKRDPLWALGYPSMIDHPAFHLHRGSLDAERYFPYLCPWVIGGHLALFSANDGYLTGRCYNGMAGGPVLDDEGHVVGVLLDGQAAPDHPALARFHRLV
jgi:hypothetical protein